MSKEKTIKLLAIGNSFSQDALYYLPDILKSIKINNFCLTNMVIGGCSLQTHLENLKSDKPSYLRETNFGIGWNFTDNVKLKEVILSEEWDYITLQQASHYSGISETYKYLNDITEFLKNAVPNAKILWHMTWAYQKNSDHWAFKNYGNDQMNMYNAILDCVKNNVVTNKSINSVIPSGTAVQNARTSFLGDNITRDGFHMSYDIGRYIVALCYANVLTEKEIRNLHFAPENVTLPVKQICIESVINAVNNPFRIAYFQK